MAKNIVVTIKRGVVDTIYSSDPSINVTVIDYDNGDDPKDFLMAVGEDTTAQNVIDTGLAVY